MSAYQGQKTLRKRLLGAELRRYRGKNSADSVALGLGVSKSKIIRQENGLIAVSEADLAKFILLYEVTNPAEVARLEMLRKTGRTRGTWHSYGPHVGPSLRDLADAETIATSMRMWEVGVVPGILQTADYSVATIKNAGSATLAGPNAHEDLIRWREERKLVLDRADPPQIWAVIGEGALRQQNGGPKVLKAQIEHLLDLEERPNITLQVLPFSAGVNPGASGSFLLLGFEIDANDQALYLEVSRAITDDPELVIRNRRRMDILISQALSPRDSRQCMLQISATL